MKQVNTQFTFIFFVFLFLVGSSFSAFAGDEFNGRIQGRVITQDGQPAAWVTVSIEATSITAITDENGAFLLKNLKPGKYFITVSSVGLESQTQEVNVSDDHIATIQFQLHNTSKSLSEIIISGKRNQNVLPVNIGKVAIASMNLPQSIYIVGENTLRNQQTQRLSDVIKNVNGMALSATRGGVQETFTARGYRISSDNVFKNGARTSAGTMPEMSSLEKVEILKGSAAILYGNVAPGGIINMITKKPLFDFGGEITLRNGSYGLIKPTVDFYGPISKKIAFRINGVYEQTNSYRDVVKSERFYVNPSLLFKINEKTTALFQVDYLNQNFTPDFGIGSLDNTIIPDLPRNTFQGTPWQYNKINQTSASFSLAHKLNNQWKINFLASYEQYSRDYYSTERIQANANGDWQRPLNKILSNENYYLTQLDITGKFDLGFTNHTLLAGIDADKNVLENFAFDNPKIYDVFNILDHSKYVPRTDIPIANKISKTITPVKRIGVYVQDLISLSNKIKLLAGIRWSKQMPENVTTSFIGKDSMITSVQTNAQAFSPRVGLVYKPFPHTALFASYSNSFSINKGTDVYGNALDPSIIDQYELGVKNELFGGKLILNITAYNITNNNLAQTAQFEADGVTPNNNTNLKEMTGQTISKGLEVDIVGQPIKGLDIMMGYSFNHMVYSKTPNTKGSYVEGEQLVGNPSNTANGSLFYTFSKKLKGLKIGGSVFYLGDRFAGWNNTKGQTQNYSRLIPVKGFTTIDLSLGYQAAKWSFMAKVSNIENVYNYFVHENYSINPIPPRQYVATISYRF